jgi:alpha-beta hydrolase superfamily lysophospholipase
MFTDDGYLALYELMKQAYDLSGFRCTNPSLPVLFISGAEDPCMGNVRKFSKAVHAMRYAGYRRVKGRLYPGMRHEILNEKEHEKVFQDILIYMKKNLPAPKAQV